MGKKIIRGILLSYLILSATYVWGTQTPFENGLREFKEWNDSLVKNLILAEEVGRYDTARFQEALSDWQTSKRESERIKAEIISEIKRNPAETMAAMEKFIQSKAGRRSKNLFADLIDLNKGYLGAVNALSPASGKGVAVSNSVKSSSRVPSPARPAFVEMQRTAGVQSPITSQSGPYLTPQQQFETLLKIIKDLGMEERRSRVEIRDVKTPDEMLRFIERTAQNQEDLVRRILAIRVTVPKLKPVTADIVKAIETQIATIRQTGYAARSRDKKLAGSIKQDVLANNMKGRDLGGDLARIAAEELGQEKAQALFRR